MKICECCGQEIRNGLIAVIRVDDQLLALCNRAHDVARSRGHAEVEIAHLTTVLMGWPFSNQFLERWGMRPDDLEYAAHRWLLENAATASLGSSPVTSADLKDLLQRTQSIASRQGREFAGPNDFLESLLTDSAKLKTASFVGWARASQSRRNSTAEFSAVGGADRSHGAETGAPFFDPPQQKFARLPTESVHAKTNALAEAWEQRKGFGANRASHSAFSDSGVSIVRPNSDDDDRLLRSLLRRLERQEEQLVKIQAQFSQLEARHKRQDAFANRTSPIVQGPAARLTSQTLPADSEPHQFSKPSGERESRRRSKLGFTRRRWSRSETHAAIESPTNISGHKRSVFTGRASLSVVSNSADKQERLNGNDVDSLGSYSDNGDHAQTNDDRDKRFYLAPDDEIVRAPSIGQKTAARLMAFGIHTVRDLLKCNPAELANKSGGRFITMERVQDWQEQARLVCTIPWLRGTHAQLLVGAGYKKLENIVNADGTAVWNAILQFSSTRDGQSILRTSPPPDVERVALWVRHAALADPARAA